MLYAVLWGAYAVFYQAFGLTPNDLGFGYFDLLAAAAVGTVGFTIFLGAGFSLYILVFHVAPFAIRGVWAGDLVQEQTSQEANDAAAAPKSDQTPARRAARLQTLALLAGVAIYV